MLTIKIINLLANLILSYSLIMFYLYLYGDNDKIVHRWSFIGHWTLKLGIITMITGTIFNMLTFNKPSLSQLCLNVGLAITFVWVYLFHKELFEKRLKEKTDVK